MNQAPAIQLDQLTKSFRVLKARSGAFAKLRDFISPRREHVTAVHSVSFTIQPGERVAFIGPNGAGKSTTLKTPGLLARRVFAAGLARYSAGSRFGVFG